MGISPECDICLAELALEGRRALDMQQQQHQSQQMSFCYDYTDKTKIFYLNFCKRKWKSYSTLKVVKVVDNCYEKLSVPCRDSFPFSPPS